jgi:hypothetical protein
MPQRDLETTTAAPEEPGLDELLAKYPPRVTRVHAAEIVCENCFEVSPRTIESWPIRRVLVNGRAHLQTREVLEHAFAKLRAAPVVMGGRRAAADQVA